MKILGWLKWVALKLIALIVCGISTTCVVAVAKTGGLNNWIAGVFFIFVSLATFCYLFEGKEESS